MSLIRHFKLDGNATDSITGVANSPSNITWVDGKLGQSGNFVSANSSKINYGSVSSIFPLPQFTISAWVKSSGPGAGISMSGIISISYGLVLSIRNDGLLVIRMDTGTSLPTYGGSGTSLFDNKWHHVCAIMIGNTLKLFSDGSLVYTNNSVVWSGKTRWTTMNGVIGTDSNNPPVYYFNGLIDDVRVYNHALSEKEVLELSKGCALKYDFSQSKTSTTNEWPANMTPWYSTVTQITSPDPFGGTRPVFRVSGNGKVRFGVTDGTDIGTLYYGKHYVFSIYLRKVKNQQEPSAMEFDICDRANIVSYTGNLGDNLTYSWKRFWVYAYHNNNTNYHFIDVGAYNSGDVWEYTCPQIEERTFVTDYVDNTRIDSIEDMSGQGNVGVLNDYNCPEWVNDSIVGNGCYKFNNINHYIRVDNNFANMYDFTMSVWVKPNANHKHYDGAIMSSGNWNSLHWALSLKQTNNGIRTRQPNIDIPYTFTTNNWYHIVWKRDINNVNYFYVNGELVHSETNNTYVPLYSYHTITYIGADTYTSDVDKYFEFNGSISNPEIYTTALSESEINKLYKQRASLDSQGNFHA